VGLQKVGREVQGVGTLVWSVVLKAGVWLRQVAALKAPGRLEAVGHFDAASKCMLPSFCP